MDNCACTTTPLLWPEGWVIYWDVVARFAQILTVPVLALIALLAIRPIVGALLANGGSIGAGGFNVQLNKGVAEAVGDAEVEADVLEESGATSEEEIRAEARQAQNEAAGRDKYDRVMDGWERVGDGLAAIYKSRLDVPINRKDYGGAIDTILAKDLLSKRFARSLHKLLDVRNQVKTLGQQRIDRAGLTDESTQHFYQTCVRLARGLRKIAEQRNAGDAAP